MISLYKKTNTNFDRNGNVVLTPTKCTHHQVAAGKYDLSMTHPLDPDGKWTYLVPEAVIKAPVPPETIETAMSGIEADLYRTTVAAALRSGTSEPTAIVYSEFDATHPYTVGNKVTYTATNYRHNYQLVKQYTSAMAPNPVIYTEYWRRIADSTEGSPVIVELKAGTDLYYVEAVDSTWCKVTTLYGLEGYIKLSQIEFIRHLTPAETEPRKIKEQLFRIRTVNVDTKSDSVTVTAEHVSYDLSGILVESAKIVRQPAAVALAWLELGFMMDYQGTIATDMTTANDGLFSGEFSGQNAINTLLNPDTGVVAKLDAMYRRDNWDLFVMKKRNKDRGFRLRYGVNMIGVSWNIKTDSLITRVVPVAKDANGNDLYLDGTKWVDSADIGNWPVIRMERIRVNGQVGKDDGTETATNWTESTLRDEMERQAMDRFGVDKVDQAVHEITVDFQMLGDADEYRQWKDLKNVLLYDTVIVINEEIGLSATVQVSELEYDCIRKTVTALKLSNVTAHRQKDTAGFNVFNNSITGDKITDDTADQLNTRAVDDANDYTDEQVTDLKAWANNRFVQR